MNRFLKDWLSCSLVLFIVIMTMLGLKVAFEVRQDNLTLQNHVIELYSKEEYIELLEVVNSSCINRDIFDIKEYYDKSIEKLKEEGKEIIVCPDCGRVVFVK